MNHIGILLEECVQHLLCCWNYSWRYGRNVRIRYQPFCSGWGRLLTVESDGLRNKYLYLLFIILLRERGRWQITTASLLSLPAVERPNVLSYIACSWVCCPDNSFSTSWVSSCQTAPSASDNRCVIWRHWSEWRSACCWMLCGSALEHACMTRLFIVRLAHGIVNLFAIKQIFQASQCNEPLFVEI